MKCVNIRNVNNLILISQTICIRSYTHTHTQPPPVPRFMFPLTFPLQICWRSCAQTTVSTPRVLHLIPIIEIKSKQSDNFTYVYINYMYQLQVVLINDLFGLLKTYASVGA